MKADKARVLWEGHRHPSSHGVAYRKASDEEAEPAALC